MYFSGIYESIKVIVWGKGKMRKLMALGVRTGGRGGRWEVSFRGDEENPAVFRVHLDLGGERHVTDLRSLGAGAESRQSSATAVAMVATPQQRSRRCRQKKLWLR
jgi:hypothetical protein